MVNEKQIGSKKLNVYIKISGPVFTKRTDGLPQDHVKSRSREIRVYNFPIALKFDRHLGIGVTEMAIKL